MKPTLFAILLLCLPGAVAAADEPTAVRVDMFFDGKLWPGMMASGDDAGWRVPLERPAGARACVVQLRDVSPGPLGRVDRSERIDGRSVGAVTLVRARYTASHTYRMSLRCGAWRSAETLVQLLPSVEELRAWRDVQGGSAIAAR